MYIAYILLIKLKKKKQNEHIPFGFHRITEQIFAYVSKKNEKIKSNNHLETIKL